MSFNRLLCFYICHTLESISVVLALPLLLHKYITITTSRCNTGTWMGSQRFGQSGYTSSTAPSNRPSWTTNRPSSSSPHGPPTLPRDPMRASAIISAAHQHDNDDDDDDSASGTANSIRYSCVWLLPNAYRPDKVCGYHQPFFQIRT